MPSRLDDLFSGGSGFRDSFDGAVAIAGVRISASDRLDTWVDFLSRRGFRYCPIAFETLIGPVFDQDSAEEFEQLGEEFPVPPDVVVDEEGFSVEEDPLFDDLDLDPVFDEEFSSSGIPGEPRDEFGDFGFLDQEDFDFFLEAVFSGDEVFLDFDEAEEPFLNFDPVGADDFEIFFEGGF